jgi:predicted amidohydrolase
MKIAVASPPYPASLADGLHWVERLTKDAAQRGAEIVCFPESYLPGYPMDEFRREACTEEQLHNALAHVAALATANAIAVIIPMDWYVHGATMNVAHVISRMGEILGHQTKNQLDPTEDLIWQPGIGRSIFEVGDLKFGIVICHEGFRYPESVRWAARRGAHVVFHPNLTGGNRDGKKLTEWGSKENPYYEKAQMVRAMENTIYFATSNYSFLYPESASAIIAPDGSCVAHQPYGEPGVTVADIDLEKATGFLAKRFKPEVYS